MATLTAIYLAAYGDLLDRFFAFDDFAVLAEADGLHGPAGLARIFVPWPSFAQYRPLTTLGYFWLARDLFGLDPRPWMAVQLAAHVLNALLVFGIVRRLLASYAAGLAAALVYASAPGHALAVRWIAFTTIWATVLVYFLGLWTWLRAGNPWRLPATLALFVVALLSSEHAVSFPLAVTAVAVLGQGRRDWRRLAREVAPLWIVGGLYVVAKLVFLYGLFPARDPVGAAFFQRAYALSFDGGALLQTLGTYVAAALAPLYAPVHSPAWCRTAGAVTLGLAAVALVAALWTGRRWLGLTACGLVLFVVGLGPVLFLPEHVYPAYIGIGALGMALALIAPLAALPRGGALALAVAAALVAVHLRSTAAMARTAGDFDVIERTATVAARWLATLDRAAGADTREVVVPQDEMTVRLFGVAHRIFLCAPYTVRMVPDVGAVPPAPGRVVLARPSGPVPSAEHGWRAIRCDGPPS